MKTLKILAPMIVVLMAAIGTFAFTAKSSAKTTTGYGWYVMDQGTDPTEPSSYSYRENFDPETEGCDGSVDVCAILTNGDGLQPYISAQPVKGQNVDDLLLKN